MSTREFNCGDVHAHFTDSTYPPRFSILMYNKKGSLTLFWLGNHVKNDMTETTLDWSLDKLLNDKTTKFVFNLPTEHLIEVALEVYNEQESLNV